MLFLPVHNTHLFSLYLPPATGSKSTAPLNCAVQTERSSIAQSLRLYSKRAGDRPQIDMNPRASTHTGSFTGDIVSCNAQTTDGSDVNKTRHKQKSRPNSRRFAVIITGSPQQHFLPRSPSRLETRADRSCRRSSTSGLSSRAARPLDVFALTRVGGERIPVITKEP